MKLLYVSESGDSGRRNSPSKLHVLAGVIIEDNSINEIDEKLQHIRRQFYRDYDLDKNQYIQFNKFMNAPYQLYGLHRSRRFRIIRRYVHEVAKQDIHYKVLLVLNSKKKTDSWQAIMEQFSLELDTDIFSLHRQGIVVSNTANDKVQLSASDNINQIIFNITQVKRPRDYRLLELSNLIAYLTFQEKHPSSYSHYNRPDMNYFRYLLEDKVKRTITL